MNILDKIGTVVIIIFALLWTRECIKHNFYSMNWKSDDFARACLPRRN